MKKALLASVVAVILSLAYASGEARAQDSIDAAPVATQPVASDAAVAAPSPAEGENGDAGTVASDANENVEGDAEGDSTSIGDLAQGGKSIYSEWSTVGWMAGMVALLAFLILLLKFKPIDEYFRVKELNWLKPILAAALGGVMTMLAAMQGGMAWGPALVAGVMFGFSATGLYETVKRRKAENREK